MRRPKPPKLCRNPDGRAFVILPGSRKKRKYLGRYGSEEADEAYKAFLRDWAGGGDAAPQPVTPKRIIHLATAYLEFAEGYYGSGTTELANVRTAIHRFVKFAGARPITAIGSGLVIEYRDSMLKAKYRKGGAGALRHYSRHTINRDVGFICRMVKWALGREFVSAEQYLRVKAVEPLRRGRSTARETAPVAPVPWEKVEQTLPHLPPIVQAMVKVQFLCGLRPGEVCAMRVEEIDRSGEVWLLRPGLHKNAHRGQALVKAIPPAAQEHLVPWIAERTAGPAFLLAEVIPEGRQNAERRTKSFRETFTTSVYARTIARACEKAFAMPEDLRHPQREAKRSKGLSESQKKALIEKLTGEAEEWRKANCWTPNQLRHAIATHLRHQFGWEAAQHYLGHASPDTTAIYADRSIQSLTATARLLTLPTPSEQT